MATNSEKLVNLIQNNKNVDAYKQLDKILKEKVSKRVDRLLKKKNKNKDK